MKSFLAFAFFFLFVQSVIGHSWLACSDYRINSQADNATYNPANCFGFPRNWKNNFAGSGFGVDTGYNYQPTGTALFKFALSTPYSNFYDATYPMAQYSPGQKVCLAWPSKNHVSATCINPNIPDNGLKIYVSGANPTTDATAFSQMRLVKDFGANTVANGYVGFQACPLFCSNPDKSTCSGCFTVPADLQVGSTYTFAWLWAFNSASDLYSSSWEATIVGGSTTATPGGNGGTTASSGNVGSTTGSNSAASQVACTANSDCPSGVCEITGFCQPKKGLGAAGVAAIIFALACVFITVILVVVVVFRKKLLSRF